MTNIIHIVGASGAGTSTLGQALEQHGYKWLDTDNYFWLPTDPPFVHSRSRDERTALLKAAIEENPKCVISDSLCGWGDVFIPKFNLVVFVDTPTDIRIERLKKRETERFGDRIHNGGDMYEEHLKFIEWAKTYDTAGTDQRSRTLHEEWFKQLPCPLLRVDGTKSVEELVEQVNSLNPLHIEPPEDRQSRIYPIILSEYNPDWPKWFAEEKANLERLIGAENIARIDHFGSTSVPGLLAKPTMDILLEIAKIIDIEKLIELMPNEYICLQKEGNSLSEHDKVMFLKGYTDTGFADKVFHIHVRYPGNYDELYFRDYLIAHPEAAAEYADLKRNLFKNYEHDRDGYTAAKSEFIRRVTKKARKL